MAFMKMSKCQFYLETKVENVKYHHDCVEGNVYGSALSCVSWMCPVFTVLHV